MAAPMSDLIDSVATLVDMRNRDDLEFTLASVMLDLLRASSVVFWQTSRRGGGRFARERVRIDVDAPGSLPADGELPIATLGAEAQTAYAARRPTSAHLEDGAVGRHMFPLVAGSEVVGLVEIVARPALDDEHMRLAQGLTRIYRSHLGILESSDTDELTGLFNRRPFDETFRGVAVSAPAGRKEPRARAHDTFELSGSELAIADIDFFKRVNDVYGHPYGDEVLVLIARLMRETLRDKDRLFRFGGEEFVILIANADPRGAEAALERFRRAVEAFSFPQVGHVTISIGVTTIRPSETGSDAYGRADAALYEAKRSGRNRVLRYETLVSQGTIAVPERVLQEVDLF